MEFEFSEAVSYRNCILYLYSTVDYPNTSDIKCIVQEVADRLPQLQFRVKAIHNSRLCQWICKFQWFYRELSYNLDHEIDMAQLLFAKSLHQYISSNIYNQIIASVGGVSQQWKITETNDSITLRVTSSLGHTSIPINRISYLPSNGRIEDVMLEIDLPNERLSVQLNRIMIDGIILQAYIEISDDPVVAFCPMVSRIQHIERDLGDRLIEITQIETRTDLIPNSLIRELGTFTNSESYSDCLHSTNESYGQILIPLDEEIPLMSQQHMLDLMRSHSPAKHIGDMTCKNNARSQYLRCTINPDGPCEGCPSYER